MTKHPFPSESGREMLCHCSMFNCHLSSGERSSLLNFLASMATVRFTQNIQRHVSCPTREVSGTTLRDVLDDYFRDNERARGYVLDEQGKVRQHMVVFIDGEAVRDRNGLNDPDEPNAVIDLI